MTVAIFRPSLATRLARAVRALFSSGQQGAWFDHSDSTTLFQDSAGSTAITAGGQPNGLRLDKRLGLVLGSELVASAYTGTATGGFSITSTSIVRDGVTPGGNAQLTLLSEIAVDTRYQVAFTCAGLSGDSTAIRVGSTAVGDYYNITTAGTYIVRLPAGGAGTMLAIIPYGVGIGGITITNISVRELPGNHSSKATAAARPTYQISPARITLDKVDDAMSMTVPTGGFVGTMILSTTQGTAAYGCNIPAGAYSIGGPYHPGTDIVGELYRHGALTEAEITAVSAYMVSKGGGPAGAGAYAVVTDFYSYWRGKNRITSFPLINSSAATDIQSAWYGCSSLASFPLINTATVTNFSYAWYGCSSLASFPLINTATGTNFSYAWSYCSSLASFPLINVSAGTNFLDAWYGCSSLASFPANMFNACLATNFTDAFGNCALTQTSVDNILISINTAGTSGGTLNMTGGTSATPSAAGLAAKSAMVARGWTVTTN